MNFAHLSRRFLPQIARPFSTAATRKQLTIPYTPTCPSPTCDCAAMPPDLDIDRKSPLLNTMAAYSEQVILCTGKEDWESNIEHEQGETGDFVKGLKSVIGRGSPDFDPFTHTLITASSLPKAPIPNTTTALLFPSFLRIPHIPHTPTAFSALATAYLKPTHLHPLHPAHSQQPTSLLRNPALASALPPAEPIATPTLFICSHAARDSRCGTLGPILAGAFRAELRRRDIDADVACVSHVGGHKFAGNVVLYIPPGWRANALAGCGIWYGRVGTREVEGLVGETLVRGRVVGELLRGGVMQGGGDLGRMVEAQRRREEGDGEQGLRLRPRRRGE